MAIFKIRRQSRVFIRYLSCASVVITIIVLFEHTVNPNKIPEITDYLQPTTLNWEHINLDEILRPEQNTIIIEPKLAMDVCQGEEMQKNRNSIGELKIFIIVTSAPAHQEARTAIRDSWGNKATLPSEITTLFMLGTTQDALLNKLIEEEADQHQDMIVEDFLDSYDNLTIKSLYILKWITEKCPSATHLLKTDDDMLIHVDNLKEELTRRSVNFPTIRSENEQIIRMIDEGDASSGGFVKRRFMSENHKSNGESKISGAYLLGYLYQGVEPDRNTESKWFLPHSLYPDEYLPDFISGTAYVISNGNGNEGAFKAILRNSLMVKPVLPLEDVFITGVVAGNTLHIPLLKCNSAFHKIIPAILPWSLSSLATCYHMNSIAIHGLDSHDIKRGWASIQELDKKRCFSIKGYLQKTLYSYLSVFQLQKQKS